MITIVDYGMGNLGSIANMLRKIGASSHITSDPQEIRAADKLILPGVGRFGRAMTNLRNLGITEALDEAVIGRERPLLGICLGMQLLTRFSEEGDAEGLGWIGATTRRISPPADAPVQVPHMGWNRVQPLQPHALLQDQGPDARYYFVHSYRVCCDDPTQALGATDYSGPFHSVIGRGHIVGVQFHPEKSHRHGFRLLASFAAWREPVTAAVSIQRDLVFQTDISGRPPAENEAPQGSGASHEGNLVRTIPTLLLRDRGLVKTQRFRKPQYVGDPRNAVKIFNEKEVDELVLLDIDATVQSREPQYDLLREIISEAFMPIAYGGGVRTLDQARRVLHAGAEKILLNSAAAENPGLVTEIAEHFGSQSVVVVVDVAERGLLRKTTRVCYRSGTKTHAEDPVTYARRMAVLGAGEILLQSIDRDGMGRGYDLDLIAAVSSAVRIPVIAVGGAGSIDDLVAGVSAGASAVAAGSLFVFQGRHRAVLINYPKPSALRRAFAGVGRTQGKATS